MNSGTKLLLGAIAGAAAGVLVAGFFTEEGSQVTSRVLEGSKDLANNMKGKLGDLKDKAVDTYASVKQHATDLVQEGISKGSDVASNLK